MNHLLHPEPLIRVEEPGDAGPIRRIYVLAFESYTEADLVDALRASGEIVLSMVALAGEELVGHALVSPAEISSEKGGTPLLALGPVAVTPAAQGRGIGTHLIASCLERLREQKHGGVVVVGEPRYYSRFGFIPASRWRMRLESSVPDVNFMALELSPGRLAGVHGVVRYQPGFFEG
jgi:putative acetyltransferase